MPVKNYREFAAELARQPDKPLQVTVSAATSRRRKAKPQRVRTATEATRS